MKITKEYLKQIIKEELQKEGLFGSVEKYSSEKNIIGNIKNLDAKKFKNYAPTLRRIGSLVVKNDMKSLSDFALSLRGSEDGRVISELIGNIQHYIPTVKDKNKQLEIAKILDKKAEQLEGRTV